jgi:hypothetical protein
MHNLLKIYFIANNTVSIYSIKKNTVSIYRAIDIVSFCVCGGFIPIYEVVVAVCW